MSTNAHFVEATPHDKSHLDFVVRGLLGGRWWRRGGLVRGLSCRFARVEEAGLKDPVHQVPLGQVGAGEGVWHAVLGHPVAVTHPPELLAGAGLLDDDLGLGGRGAVVTPLGLLRLLLWRGHWFLLLLLDLDGFGPLQDGLTQKIS